MFDPSTTLSRRSFVGATAGALAAAGLASLGLGGLRLDAAPAYASDGGKTFTYAIPLDPTVSPNVMTSADRVGLTIVKLIYSPLWMCDVDGISYFLAESFEQSDDLKTLTVHLREGVKWNGGEPFTADDVVFTLEAMENNEISATYGQLVYDEGKVAVEKVDDLTVTVTFPTVNASATEMLSGIFIAPKHLYEGVSDWENNDVNSQGVGTGPYKLDEYQVGQYLTFSANPDYFLGAPKVDTVVLRVISNENTAMQAIQAGEVNAWAATATQVEQMNVEGSGLVVHPYSENRVIYAMFNAQNVTDENIRKAFFFSLDRPTLALAACLSPDYYEEDVSFLPANNAFATTDIETYARNVDKAKELLAQAGQANPSISISYGADDTMRQTIAILMQEQASEAGFNVTLNALETNALNGKLLSEENDLQVFLGGYVNGIDPDTYFATFGTTATYNFMHYDEPEIDELFAQGRTEADEAKRKEIYAQLQAKVADTGCFYPMFTDKRLLVTTANVTGVDEAKLVPVYTFGDMSKLDIEA